jgi:hypothetical protein
MIIRNDGSREDVLYSRDKEVTFTSTAIDGTIRNYFYNEIEEKEIEYLRRVDNWRNPKKISYFKGPHVRNTRQDEYAVNKTELGHELA